ncbi:MAG: hydrogenase formation protein HypD [Actinomycetota bacterium]|nr:hydrogenase formation protein HypD [Actinomycetota bacterium]
MRHLDEFRVPGTVKALGRKINSIPGKSVIMEVCGTHTMAAARFGLRSMLRPRVEFLSGPGCPVCVTPDGEIDRARALAFEENVIIATFGDMMKVPGTVTSLSEAVARGARVKVVYSPLQALELAEKETEFRIVFLGVGFETTAPTVASTLLEAKKRVVKNFFVLSLHKLVPPALRALVSLPEFRVDGFLLPGHVSAIIGSKPYEFLPEEFNISCVIAGFEPSDILEAILRLISASQPVLDIQYSRVVRENGNEKALDVMNRVFEKKDSEWRGIGLIKDSGLALRDEFREFDAWQWPVLVHEEPRKKSGCRCGDVLCGFIKPLECPFFADECNPDNPLGPCMVSSEGTCAAYFYYEVEFRGSEVSGEENEAE